MFQTHLIYRDSKGIGNTSDFIKAWRKVVVMDSHKFFFFWDSTSCSNPGSTALQWVIWRTEQGIFFPWGPLLKSRNSGCFCYLFHDSIASWTPNWMFQLNNKMKAWGMNMKISFNVTKYNTDNYSPQKSVLSSFPLMTLDFGKFETFHRIFAWPHKYGYLTTLSASPPIKFHILRVAVRYSMLCME